NGHYTGGLAINCHEDRGRALLTKTVGLSSERADIDAGFFHNAQVADDETAPFDRTRHALADRRIEILNVGDHKPEFLRRLQDGRAERMLAAALQTGCQPQHVILT